jgi:hypothetical protein
MRKLFFLLAAASFLIAATANAGALLTATYGGSQQGVPYTIVSTSATGTFDGTTFSLDAKNGTITATSTYTYHNAMSASYVTMVTSMRGDGWFATKFVVPAGTPNMMTVPSVNLTFGNNGTLSGAIGDGTFTPTNGGVIQGTAIVNANFGGGTMPFLYVPVSGGYAGSSYFNASPLFITLFGDNFHTNMITQTGLTDDGAGEPNVVATGDIQTNVATTTVTTVDSSIMFTLMNVDVITLVTMGKTIVSGLATNTTAAPTTLTLYYATAAPEPGTLVLLGAGVLGLAAIGRRKLS